MASEDAASRLRGLVRDMHLERQAAESSRQVVSLEQRRFDAEQEIAVLQQLLEQARKRQGITGPTEG